MEQTGHHHIGIDYGSQLAGTTAVAKLMQGRLKVWQSPKSKNADEWLQDLVEELEAKVIYLDAPLTLPAVYTMPPGAGAGDYFYRQADRELQAMSPMFIGGLTARAMRLRAIWAEAGIATLETYPAALNRLLLPQLEGYKKSLASLPDYVAALQGKLSFEIAEEPQNWHQFDAILAWLSGYRHQTGQSVLYGQAQEGRVIV
ncbi:hypothetical protein ACXYMU_06965 [Pontibacter sp. CAU 1760]